MIEVLQAAVERAHSACELVLSAATNVEPAWLAAGVGLQVISQVVRIRGWWHILLAAFPSCSTLRSRDVTAAYFAGAGLNGLLPGRGGDLVKYSYLHRRIPGSRFATLIGSSVPETTFESLCGAVLVAWLLAVGFVPVPLVPGEIPAPDASWYLTDPVTASLSTAAAVSAAIALLAWLRRRSRKLVGHLGQGLAIFASPRRYLLHVATWQALGRVIRLGALACFLAAFTLPATPRTALLVMAAQGAGRIVPLAPVSAGLRIAVLTYGLVEITDRPVDPAAVSAFTFGVSAILFLVMLGISLVFVGRELQTISPRCALRRARARLRGPARMRPPGANAAASRRSWALCRARRWSTIEPRSNGVLLGARTGSQELADARSRAPPSCSRRAATALTAPRTARTRPTPAPSSTPEQAAHPAYAVRLVGCGAVSREARSAPSCHVRARRLRHHHPGRRGRVLSLSILATQLGNHLPVPAPALFLVAAAVASDGWPALRQDVSVRTVECVGLIVVLLNGGMDTGWRRFRAAAWPIMAIGIAGTFITAAVLTGTAHWLLGMDWNLAGVVGAAWRRPTPPSCSPFWVSRSAAVVIDRRPRQRSSPA